MTSSVALPAAQASAVGRPRFDLVGTWRWGWWAIAMRGVDLFLSLGGLVLLVVALGGFFSLPAIGGGALLLVPALWGAWGLGRAEHRMLVTFAGVDIGRPPPSPAPTWRRVLGLDLNRLRALGWASLHALWGLLASVVVLGLLTVGILMAGAPFARDLLPDGLRVLWLTPVTSDLGYAVLCAAGVVLLLGVLPLLARALVGVDVALARWLVGADPQAALSAMSQRVQALTTTRTETVDSVEAERRRIERDLHDGPQQRLVAIAMNLGLARTLLDTDPAAARGLLDEAHAASKEAIVEMRQVARGIVPPILSDRGLDAAVSALAVRSPIPVEVTSRLPGQRLEPTVESIAYFCISEALTNAAKHSGASRVRVDLGRAVDLHGEHLAIRVADDGRGGAVVGGGSGLTGLRQRLASVDGDLQVHSPPGGGTTVSITLPLRTARAA